MTTEMLLIATLHLIHIVSAVIWVGVAFALAMMIVPPVKGEEGMRYMKAFMNKSRISIIFPIAASLTTLAGIILYATGSPSRFTTTGNMVLGVGTLAGLLAFGHGASAMRSLTTKLTQALNGGVLDENPSISATILSELTALVERYRRNGMVSLLLSLIALVGMGAARYM